MPDETPNSAISGETPLQGWKEIAAYLDRDRKTTRRWELEANLPIRRHRSDRRSSVYAYPSELDAWRASRPPQGSAAEDETSPRSPRLWVLAAVAAVAVVGALVLLRESKTLDSVAEAEGGIRITEIYSMADVGEISPDGRYLSETDWENSGDIGIRDLQTNEFRKLGSKASWSEGVGEADQSIFSPDGSKIAYNWATQRSGAFRYELRVVDAFGASPRERTVYFNPDFLYIEPTAWTRDDRLVVSFQRGDWSRGIGIVDLDTGNLTVFKSGGSSEPMLSHSGKWIAYDRVESGGARDAYLLSIDGSTEVRATEHRAQDVVMGFAPADSMLLFASDRMGSYSLWGQPLVDGRPWILALIGGGLLKKTSACSFSGAREVIGAIAGPGALSCPLTSFRFVLKLNSPKMSLPDDR